MLDKIAVNFRIDFAIYTFCVDLDAGAQRLAIRAANPRSGEQTCCEMAAAERHRFFSWRETSIFAPSTRCQAKTLNFPDALAVLVERDQAVFADLEDAPKFG